MRKRLFWALCVAVATWLGIYVATHLQRIQETRPVPPSRHAAHNKFLAATRILERLGYVVREAHEIARGSLPPTSATLIIAVPRTYLNERRSLELLDWVGEGGHLVVVPTLRPTTDDEASAAGAGDSNDEDDVDDSEEARFVLDDPIFAAAGVNVLIGDESALAAELPWLGQKAATGGPELHEVTASDGPTFSIGPDSGTRLTGDADVVWDLSDEYSTMAASVAFGDGLLTLLADARFLQNRYIGYGDNAALLLQLVELAPDAGEVWVTTSLEPPAFFDLIQKYAGLVTISLLLLLGAWLWRHAVRLGPTLEAAPLARRSLLEHIESSGLFLWRYGGRSALVRAAQEAVRARARRRTPGWSRMSPAERGERIAGLCGEDAQEVRTALCAVGSEDPAHMVAVIQQLERLRLKL